MKNDHVTRWNVQWNQYRFTKQFHRVTGAKLEIDAILFQERVRHIQIEKKLPIW